jgi:hypothetical protein
MPGPATRVKLCYGAAPMTPALRILFEKPGFFVSDCRLVVMLDAAPVYDGSFMSGLDVQGQVATGRHLLETQIVMGPIVRRKSYAFEIADGRAYVARLRYSRLWGNFKGRLELTAANG